MRYVWKRQSYPTPTCWYIYIILSKRGEKYNRSEWCRGKALEFTPTDLQFLVSSLCFFHTSTYPYTTPTCCFQSHFCDNMIYKLKGVASFNHQRETDSFMVCCISPSFKLIRESLSLEQAGIWLVAQRYVLPVISLIHRSWVRAPPALSVFQTTIIWLINWKGVCGSDKLKRVAYVDVWKRQSADWRQTADIWLINWNASPTSTCGKDKLWRGANPRPIDLNANA